MGIKKSVSARSGGSGAKRRSAKKVTATVKDDQKILYRTAITLSAEIPVIRKDRTVFYADISALIINLSGKPYLAGIFRDITDRRRGEEALRQN